jgi:hypothetical protein
MDGRARSPLSTVTLVAFAVTSVLVYGVVASIALAARDALRRWWHR